MDENTDFDDRISKLPDFILHHIMTFLTSKDAAQTCVLSKRWQHIWETFPILDCHELNFGIGLSIFNPESIELPKDVRRMIFNQRVKFMNYVDYKLRRFREENLSVNEFQLCMTLVNINLSSRVDKWLELVTDLNIKVLDISIRVGRERFYSLPSKVLASQSLHVLSLSGCLLTRFVFTNVTKLHSLVVLNLKNSFIDEETIKNVLSNFHMMETFSLESCSGFRAVEICGHNNLKRMKFSSHDGNEVEKFNIDIPSLEELEISIFGQTENAMVLFEFNVGSACQNLKDLSLTGIPNYGKWLQEISSFPQLKYLLLRFCKGVEEQVFKLSSKSLREVEFCFCDNLVEAEFDTPNLHTFEYIGHHMPRLSSNSPAAVRTANLVVNLENNNINNSWFMRLSNFLRCGRFQELSLDIVGGGSVVTFDATEFTGIQPPLPYELENLKLAVCTFASLNFAALLDGLLCNLHPKILSLKPVASPNEPVQLLFKRLLFEKSNTCPENLKFWRDSLKDIPLIGLKDDHFDTPLDSSIFKQLKFIGKEYVGDQLDSSLSESLNNYLDDLISDSVNQWLYFNLSW